jgi:N-acetylglucosaminyldiphosphoundecaprenol N-acetyl-beta-D-mannosaminyltransferase
MEPVRTPTGPSPVPESGLAARVAKREILGIPMAMTDYAGAVEVMDDMVDRRDPGWICAAPVHSMIIAQTDPELRRALVDSTITVPDGMPVVWAANLLGENLPNRVYGPELMQRYCERSAERGLRVWLYGGRDQGALLQLALTLRRTHPGIKIVGGYSPPFRPLSEAEDEDIAEQINRDRPDVIWVGIGVPKQEKWMVRMRPRLEAPVMCAVGAAFDFHAGRVSQAPRWMQERGLEWTYRIAQEPKRLLPRYLYTNPRFMYGVAKQYLRESARRA